MKILKLLLASILISLLAACGGGGSGDEVNGTSTLRVIHNSPNASNIDVFVDDILILSDIPFGTASQFLPLDAGSRNVRVTFSGTDSIVIDRQINIEADKPCTCLLYTSPSPRDQRGSRMPSSA